MARRIRKQKPRPHVVVPDTSTLWHEDKQHVIDPVFDAFWQSYATECTLELHIPDVVKGELLFQQTTSALKSLARANQAIQEIQRVTGRKYSHRITDLRVRREVEKRFSQWATDRGVRIIAAPIDAIIWPDVIRQAIWHEPPFESDPKNSDHEKGFRDALILETLVNLCSHDSRDIRIAFLCRDKLLRQTAQNRLQSDKRTSVYEAVQDFKTYLDLAKEQLEDAFIKALVRRASEKFFNKGDSACLYFRDNIKEILKVKYKRDFDNPEESESPLLSLLLPSGIKTWEAVDGGIFWISPSRFVKTDEERQYVWVNPVTYVRQYRRTEAIVSIEAKEAVETRVLVLPFYITWRARVTSDGRFWEYSYLNEELKDKVFRKRTEDDIKAWNLEG